MKLASMFRKSLREQTRDWLVLGLTLVFAPALVYLYTLFFPSGSTTYGVIVLNQDAGVYLEDDNRYIGGDQVIESLKGITYANGQSMLEVNKIEDIPAAKKQLRDRDAEVLLIIPEDFSATLMSARAEEYSGTSAVTFSGDLTNPYYAVAAVMVNAALEEYILETTEIHRPIQMLEEPLGDSAARTEFEIYVPGLLVFSIIMLVFAASMSITREVEDGTLKRLQITRMTALDFLGGWSLVFVLIGLLSILLTFLTAWLLGFRSQGPLWVAVLIGIVTSVAIIGTGLVVAGLSSTVYQAFLIANFPLAFFMFFSGAMFPIPRITIFELAGHPIGLYDVFPPTHAVTALNKVLTLGLGIEGVLYELTMLTALSSLYFLIGVWLFNSRHMRAI